VTLTAEYLMLNATDAAAANSVGVPMATRRYFMNAGVWL